MRYGIITLTWRSPFTTSDLDLLDRIAALGYDGVEIFLESEEHLDYSRAAAELARLGLEPSICVQIDGRRDVSSGDGGVRSAGIAYLKHCVDAVVAMGGALVGGPVYGDQIFYGGGAAVSRTDDEAHALRARAVASLREVAEYAGERSVTIAVEPLNRFETSLACLADQAVDLVTEIDSDAVGVQLDTYHMNIEEPSIPEAIRTAGSRLVHFHANENHRGAPGTGHIPWGDVAAGLGEIGYDGPIVTEPFRRSPAELGYSLALWHPPADEAAEDRVAADALRVLREHLG